MTHQNKSIHIASSLQPMVFPSPVLGRPEWMHCLITIIQRLQKSFDDLRSNTTFKRLFEVLSSTFLFCVTMCTCSCLEYCQRTGNGPAGVYTQQYRSGDDQVSYYWVVFGTELLFPCPPGTYFDFPKCQCLACYEDGPCGKLDFDQWILRLHKSVVSNVSLIASLFYDESTPAVKHEPIF